MNSTVWWLCLDTSFRSCWVQGAVNGLKNRTEQNKNPVSSTLDRIYIHSTCILACVCIYMCVCIHMYIYIYTSVYIVYIHMSVYITYIHVYMYIYMHSRICMYSSAAFVKRSPFFLLSLPLLTFDKIDMFYPMTTVQDSTTPSEFILF